MAYTNEYNPNLPQSGSAIGGYGTQQSTLDPVRPESELEAIASRIHRMVTSMEEIAANLRDHANAVHGPVPECEKPNACGSIRSGQLGMIYGALDRLANAQSELAEQAGRNCTLA